MPMYLRTQIVRIGNSQGIRIPKSLIKLTGLQNEVELVAEDNCLIVRNIPVSRVGWEEQLAGLAGEDEDPLLNELGPHVLEEQEWTWSW